MNYTEKEKRILNWVKDLGQSQGFYGRLYELLLQDRNYLSTLAEQDFKDCLDMVLYIEC